MDGHQLIAKTGLARRAVKCTTKVSQAVPLIYGHIHSLRPTRGRGLCRRTCMLCDYVSFKTSEIQHASMSCVYYPIVVRQLCSVHYTILQLLPYLTLPVVNLFWLAGVFLSEVRWT